MNFPPVNFPVFDVSDNIQKMDFDYIEELANETRKFWGLGVGSLSNVTWLLENQGAIVGRFPLGRRDRRTQSGEVIEGRESP